MSDAILVAIISLIGTVISVFISARATQNKVSTELQTQNAVQNQKIDQLSIDINTVKTELTEKMNNAEKLTDLKVKQLADKQQEMSNDIKEHNNYAKQLPEIQGKLDLIAEKQEVANKRINDLEQFQHEITSRLISKSE